MKRSSARATSYQIFSMIKCSECPRLCNAERGLESGAGFCRTGLLPRVARAAAHFGEEPCISGTRGSGTVFFSGCNLRCVFCQNQKISSGGFGNTVSVEDLSDIFRRIEDKGLHNINLVTASHFVRPVVEALELAKPRIPVVWNSSGYESIDALKMLEGYVSVYMPDLKYLDSALSKEYSSASDYPKVALAAIDEMYRQVGGYALDGDGILQKGLLVRHLVLPDCIDNTLDVIDLVAEHFPKKDVIFSLMSQYTPIGNLSAHPNLQRTLTPEEFSRVESYLSFSGIESGYMQGMDSATEEYIPPFDSIYIL